MFERESKGERPAHVKYVITPCEESSAVRLPGGAYEAKDAGMLPLFSEVVHSKHFFFCFQDVKTD